MFRQAYHPDGKPNITSLILTNSSSSQNQNKVMIQNYINHIVFVIDRSGSMSGLSSQVVKVFDNQIAHLAQRSKELDQETRVSVYLFSDHVECLVYDKDCLRLPSLAGLYRAGGNTALVDGTMKAIEDLEKTATLYGDHAFLIYALTDGGENCGGNATKLANKIKGLPENYTVAVFVPDQNGVFEAKRFGFPAQNISVWDTSAVNAVENTGKVISQTTDNFMRARSSGIRGTKSLFSLDAAKLNSSTVKTKLTELVPDKDYHLLNVHKDAVIKPFVESWKLPFRLGGAYYQLSKAEKIQNHKQICVQEKRSGKVYTGSEVRKLLGLPDYEVKVEPASHPDYDLFIQSTSTNRNLVAGTKLLVML